jgi:hypothetical protein
MPQCTSTYTKEKNDKKKEKDVWKSMKQASITKKLEVAN